jgi:hypothetical protein
MIRATQLRMSRPRWSLRPLAIADRVARPAVMAFALAFSVSNVWFMLSADWIAWDVNAYWDAAVRLQEGRELYIPYADVGAPEVFRYAPWFAWAWVPLTYLPREAVNVAWCAAMLGFSCLAVVPMLRTRTEAGVVIALFTWPMMAYVSVGGNVHALMVCALVYGLRTKYGPLVIALAASLKAVPLALALVYLGRREWLKFGLTLGLTALLVAPMLYYGIEDYTTDPGGAVLLSGAGWIIGVGAACVATILLARTRYGWLAAAATVVLAFPRWFLYDASLLLVGFQPITCARKDPAADGAPPTT